LKVVLNVNVDQLDQALSVAKAHLKNCPDQMVHCVDFYVAGGSVIHYHSILTPETLTVWRSHAVEG
jgi:hypothetical protein